MSKDPPGFVCDFMLGRLARYLRTLGLDTLYVRQSTPEVLLPLAHGRILLTRKRALLALRNQGIQVYLVPSEKTDEQLRWVIETFRPPLRPFTRCALCNTPLVHKTREEAKGRVPYYTWRTQAIFSYCPRCDKFYWGGTHKDAMVRRFRRILGALWPEDPSQAVVNTVELDSQEP